MFCSKCGTILPDDAVFCFRCGMKTPSAAKTAPSTEPDLLDQIYMPQLDIEVPEAPSFTAEEKPKKKKSPKKGKLIALVAVALVLVFAAGLLLQNFVFGMETVYVLTRETEYNADGLLLGEYSYEYDEFARLTSVQYDYRMGRYEKTAVGEYMGIQIESSVYVVDETCEIMTAYTEEFEYDDHGNLAENTVDDRIGMGKYPYEYDYRYTKDGHIRKFSRELANVDLVLPSEYEVDCDENGNITRVTLVGDSYNFVIGEYEYDREDRLVREIAYNKTNIAIRYDYSYEKDKIVGFERYVANGRAGDELDFNLNLEAEMEYGKHGLTKLSFYDPEGKLIRECSYSYDSKGNLEEMFYDDEAVCSYDKHGNIIRAETEDGCYIEYEYEKMRVSKQDAELYRRRSCMENWEYLSEYRGYDVPLAYYCLIPIPVVDLVVGGRLHI